VLEDEAAVAPATHGVVSGIAIKVERLARREARRLAGRGDTIGHDTNPGQAGARCLNIGRNVAIREVLSVAKLHGLDAPVDELDAAAIRCGSAEPPRVCRSGTRPPLNVVSV
jgi:hypothetical protein